MIKSHPLGVILLGVIMKHKTKCESGRHGFTLLALLVSLSIVVLLVLYMAPLYAHIKARQESSICFTNLRRLGQSTLMYATDFDETLPLTTANVNNQWLTNFSFPVPPSWSSLSTDRAVIGSKFVWPNTCRQFGIRESDLVCPSQTTVRLPQVRYTYSTPLATPSIVSYSVNGLLNAYKLANITDRARVPMLWEGRGRASGLGSVLQNPFLSCIDGNQPCIFNTSCSGITNGGTGSAFGLLSTIWVHGKRNHWLFADGHVEARVMGAVLFPSRTDRSIDLYDGYNQAGLPSTIYLDGCHPDLFRPDR